MAALPPPRPSYTARDYATMLADLQAYVQRTRPDAWSDFSTSSLGELLLEVVAYVGDIVSLGLDAASLEIMLATCRRYESALRFADSVGYVPRGAAAAAVTVAAAAVPAALAAAGGTVPAGTAVAGPAGVRFELLADATVAVGAPSVTLALAEGTSYADTFNPTNKARMRVTAAAGPAADGSWAVYVGDASDPANLWAQVPSVALEASASETYSVSFDAAGRLRVQFGDGTAGAIPTAVVTVRYRTCAGAAGNVPAGAVTGNVTAAVAGGGGTVTLAVTNAAAAAGGADRESLEELRVNVPAFVRSGDRLITVADYDAIPRRVAGVARSYAAPDFASYSGNVVDVNVWAAEAVTFTAESHTPAFRSAVPYARFAVAGSTLRNAVKAFATPRTAVTVYPKVVGPPVAWADVYVTRLAYDPRYPVGTLHPAVAAAVAAVFQDGDGFSVRLSALYDAIRAVPGVRYFTLDRVVFEYQGKARASGTVYLNAGAQPGDGDYVVVNDGAAATTYEFDSNAAVAVGNVSVAIGAGAHDTMTNLAAAVNARGGRIVATKTAATTPTVALQQTVGGAALNIGLAAHGAGYAAGGSGSSGSASSSGAVTSLRVTGMAGGSDTVGTVREDRRQVQAPSGASADPWPPGAYTPGEPFTGSAAWADGGIVPYLPMADLVVPVDRGAAQYFDAVRVFNNTLVYDDPAGLAVVPQVINLRRLVFDLYADPT